MSAKLKGVYIAILLQSVCLLYAKGQQTDSVLLKSDPYIHEIDSILLQGDSLHLFSLIDSIMSLPDDRTKSQMIARMGYNSNVVAASRTLGFNQFGLAPGLSYYHKSGIYGDVTGYWSQEYSPNYYLTVASAGYLKSPTTWWSFMAEYSHYFYSQSDQLGYIAYNNNVGVSNFLDIKNFTFRLDYQFYFGDKQAHRISPYLMYTFEKRNLGQIKRLAFFPTVSILLGSEQISEYIPYSRTLAGAYFRVRNGLPLYYEQITTKFGLLNYSFVAPISLAYKNWIFMLTYTYNIPKALPGETLETAKSGYLSASISRRIEF